MIYPVITLYQPWATWIMRGWKTIETRTHNRFTSLTGKTILIHAGMTTDSSEIATKNRFLTREQILQDPDEMINGFILGEAFVYQSRKLGFKDQQSALIECVTRERYGLFLAKIKKFDTPIPVKGEMGIWYFDMSKMEKVRKPIPKTYDLFTPKP